MKRRLHLLACFLVLTLFVQPVAAQDTMPKTMAYQGYLTNTDGDPANGSTSVTFRLYDQDSSGSVLWVERQQGVTFTEGVFSVYLGEVESLEAVSFDRPLWLGVSVNGGQELRPRVALGAVPFAMGVRGLRVEPGTGSNSETPNVISGHNDNFISAGVSGSTISGGGDNVSGSNRITGGNYATIGGGAGNEVGEHSATVSGGANNLASGRESTVSGGHQNIASETEATVGGGFSNEATEQYATVSGGSNNTASLDGATVSGGQENVASGDHGVVGGGDSNTASGSYATVGGGTSNTASGQRAVVGGGEGNGADGPMATVGGGSSNGATGAAATVPGGESNEAIGDRSFAAGYNAEAGHDGAFVWAGYNSFSDPTFASTAPGQFLIRAIGGVGIGTNAPQGPLHVTDESLDIDPTDFSNDALVVEGNQSVVGLYSTFQGSTRPGLILGGVDNGAVVDRWGIVREHFQNNRLYFTYGLNDDYTQNASVLSLSATEGPLANRFTATQDLGSNGTPSPGGHFRDNVIYAWAHVQSDGSVSASYGCTVSKITGNGSYRVTFKRQLPNGASAIVTPQGVNDPVIATVSVNANQASVATKVFNGSAFVAFDSGFYIQVVGRP